MLPGSSAGAKSVEDESAVCSRVKEMLVAVRASTSSITTEALVFVFGATERSTASIAFSSLLSVIDQSPSPSLATVKP